MIRRKFLLTLSDGEPIHGDVRLPDGPPPRSAIVVLHGFKGFKDWGFFPHACEALAEDGHAVVSFNFSLNGTAEGGEDFSRLDAFARNTFSREVEEALHVLDEVREGGLLPGRPERTGLLGHSRGGGVAVLTARDDAERGGRLHALVTWAAVARFGSWSPEQKDSWRREGTMFVLNSRTGQELPLGLGLLEDFEARKDRLDPELAARTLAEGGGAPPWLIVHGEADPTVPVEDARILAGACPTAELEVIAGAGHTFEARHPFDGAGPALDRALGVTRGHFRRHLLEEP